MILLPEHLIGFVVLHRRVVRSMIHEEDGPFEDGFWSASTPFNDSWDFEYFRGQILTFNIATLFFLK